MKLRQERYVLNFKILFKTIYRTHEFVGLSCSFQTVPQLCSRTVAGPLRCQEAGRPVRGPRGGSGWPRAGIRRTPVVTGAGEVGQRRVSVRHTRHRQNPVCSRCFRYTKKTKQTAVLDVTPVSNPTNTTDGFATTSVSL